MDSEGLLIFTNDGDFANQMMHPSHQVEKVYEVTVCGYTLEGFHRLCQPMHLDGYRLAPAKVILLDVQGQKARMQITIHEGRNRQVRRMCAMAGMTVTRLVRIREGSLELGDLPKGKWRYLTAQEIQGLKG